jgi:hypothetical protein
MARVLAQHGIEQFVYAWLNRFRNVSETRKYKRYLEKAVKQLQFFLNPPCCLDPEATIEFRRLDNDLTRFIAAQLALSLDRRKWRKSLERAITALNNIINDPCCEEMEVTFNFFSDGFDTTDPITIQIRDTSNDAVLFETSPLDFNDPETFIQVGQVAGNITEYKICVLLDQNSENIYYLIDDIAEETIMEVSDSGIYVCSEGLSPLSSSYSLNLTE